MRRGQGASRFLCAASSIPSRRLRDLEVHCAHSEGGVVAKELRIRHVGRRDSSRVRAGKQVSATYGFPGRKSTRSSGAERGELPLLRLYRLQRGGFPLLRKNSSPSSRLLLARTFSIVPFFNCSASERIESMTVRHRPTCSVNRSTSWRWPTLSLSIFQRASCSSNSHRSSF
jgi:hypothetical protein